MSILLFRRNVTPYKESNEIKNSERFLCYSLRGHQLQIQTKLSVNLFIESSQFSHVNALILNGLNSIIEKTLPSIVTNLHTHRTVSWPTRQQSGLRSWAPTFRDHQHISSLKIRTKDGRYVISYKDTIWQSRLKFWIPYISVLTNAWYVFIL